MGLKGNDACLAKAADDEPIFVLRAQDKLAPDMVRQWARQATNEYNSEHGARLLNTLERTERDVAFTQKIEEAYELASDMEQWQMRTGRAKWPD